MVASTVGLPGNIDDPFCALPAFLRDRRMLLVLDSCEHLIETIAPSAGTHLPGGSRCPYPGDEPGAAPSRGRAGPSIIRHICVGRPTKNLPIQHGA
jgi:hypothetical protein